MKLDELFLEAKKLNEDGESSGMAAPAGDGGGVAPSAPAGDSAEVVDNASGIRDEDVLGKWDPAKGFMAKGDFHIPKNVLGKGKVLKRYEIPSKKKKGLKNPYIKGMKVLEKEETIDEDLTRDSVIAIHNMEHKDMVEFVKSLDPAAKIITAIAYWPEEDCYFIRYYASDAKRSRFVVAKLNGKKFEMTKEHGNRLFTAKDVKQAYSGLKTSPKMWVVWGELR